MAKVEPRYAGAGEQQQVLGGAAPPPPYYGGTQPCPSSYQTFPTYSTYGAAASAPQPAIIVNVEPNGHGYAAHPAVPTGVKHVETFVQFSDKSIRRAFIRKVYALLTMQLCITFAFICVFIFVDPIKQFCLANWWMMLVAAGAMIVCMCLMCVVVSVRRQFPHNLIVLLLFTCCESFAVATLTTYFSINEVLMAFVCTMLIAVGVTLFTLQTKWDFTLGAVALFIFIFFIVSYGALCGLYYGCGWNYQCVTVYNSYTQQFSLHCYYVSHWNVVWCGLAVLLFSLFLMADTQQMIGGKHKFGLSPEEYIFASINLYMDVVMIFIYMLLLGGRR